MDTLQQKYSQIKKYAEQYVMMTDNLMFFSPQQEAYISYEYPCDNYIKTILSLQPVKKELNKLLNDYYRSQNIDCSNIGCKTNATSFPKLHNIIIDCSNILEIKDIPNVYVSNKLGGINALTMEINDISTILISPKSLFSLSDNELKFMIGHELSHISQGNLLCHTANGILANIKNKHEVIGTIVADLIEIPLKEWCRANEYTADRAGYLCCKDMKAVISLFYKIGKENTKTPYHNYTEIYKDHPYIQNRIDRIKEFAESLLEN